MKIRRRTGFQVLRTALIAAAIMALSGFITVLNAQPQPPRPVVINVNHSQPLAFGAFIPLIRSLASPGALGLVIYAAIYVLYVLQIWWMLRRIGRFRWWAAGPGHRHQAA